MKSLHERIEGYYDVWKLRLPPRMPICIRCDGRAFSKLLRQCEKPHDLRVAHAMDKAAIALCKQSGAQIGYTQSDEITVLLTPYTKFETQPWFGGEVEKLCSIAASICSDAFKEHARGLFLYPNERHPTRDYPAVHFDAKVAVVPRDDVHNVFVDRQQDGRRNAILGVGQTYVGKKAIHGWSCDEIVAKMRSAGSNGGLSWFDNVSYMNGRIISPWLEQVGGALRPRWTASPAPDFKQHPDFFKEYVWPVGEEM